MLTNETVSKLHEIHMGTMAAVFFMQLTDSQFNELAFEDRFSILVDAERSSRKSSQLQRLIRNAEYSIPGASIEDVSYSPERQLDKMQILRLASCAFIKQGHNIIVLGATDTGKIYLACDLGSAANRNFYATKYIRLSDLLVEIALARGDGTYRELMRKHKKRKLLILDEWLLYSLKESEARDLLELIEARRKVASTIFCAQFDVPGWHESLCDPILADAI